MKLGLMVPNLAASQAGFYLIQYVNKAVNHDGHNISVFFDTPCIPCIDVSFGIMQTLEAWAYDGPVIATGLTLAHKLVNFPGPTKKFFYIWDLEWMRLQQKNVMALAQVYRNPALKLIARSEEHARIISDCWNMPVVGVADNYDVDKFLEIVYGNHK